MFIHIDMDYFFAQLEEKRHPMAKDRIIAVCVFSGRTPDSGVVSTVNYPGRAVGIHSGMPIILAKKRAPPSDSVFLPVDREYYAQASLHIDGIIRKRFIRVVQASIDEWNLETEDQNAAEKAAELKDAIKKEAGLTATLGVAPSLIGAKMAAAKAKPDGLLALDAAAEKKMVADSDVEKVPGIGPKTGAALKHLGILKVRDIARIDAITLTETFGRKGGAWLHALGQGRYASGLGEEKEQEEVSRIGTLKEKTRDSYLILKKLDELEADAREWLLEMKKAYKTVSIIFITDDLKAHTKSASFRNPKTGNEEIAREKEALVKAFLAENPFEIRRVGIRFGNFMDLGGQTTLF